MGSDVTANDMVVARRDKWDKWEGYAGGRCEAAAARCDDFVKFAAKDTFPPDPQGRV